MKTIKTTLHYYRFDIKKESDRNEYKQLCDKLKGMGLILFDSISSDHSNFYGNLIAPLNGKKITLECEHLFDNQWNTAPVKKGHNGLRVFDWSEAIYPNKSIKEGMWLEQTKEMKSVREETCKCGYCGKNYYKPDFEFCNSCLDSEYLKEEDLPLLKLVPVSKERNRYNSKSKIEVPQSLIDEFNRRQTYAAEVTRPAAELKRSQKDLLRKIGELSNKAAAFQRLEQIAQWLFDNNVNTSNFIFYDHTQTVCIGWRGDGLTQKEVDRWKAFFEEKSFPVIWSDMIEYKVKK